MSNWTQPICDADWRSQHGDRNPSRLTIETREPEVCAFCGQITESGIYVRVDPRMVPFPTSQDD